MSEFIKKYDKIIEEIEKNIQNEEELNFIKGKINEISTMFMSMFDNMSKYSESKINALEENQSKLEQKLNKVQNIVEDMKNDIYDDYNEDDYEFEIVCPYCNNVFTSNVETDVNQEIECPECHNTIELDWNEEECCTGSCLSCSGCLGVEEEDDLDEEEDFELDKDDDDEDM